jgi:geranylgeranyl diphosphate synthase type I
MRALLSPDISINNGDVYALVAYHLGWRDASGTTTEAASGKMLRPALLLTVAGGYEATPAAVDAAVAVELLHAFSLVHDDIEDGDRERHHRPTVWALHGVPLAINAGDSLFALAHRTMIDAAASLAGARTAPAMRLFTDACLRMIEGQHEDISFEREATISRADYLRMTSGKTGALLGASLALGALFGGAPDADCEQLRAAGVDLGVAFQAVDDGLAVWGDAARTGKAVGNDAERGKKSLPAVIAGELRCEIASGEVRAGVEGVARQHTQRALAAARATSMSADALGELEAFAAFMLAREA